MSPVPTFTVPTNNSDSATEEPKITVALSDLKSLLSGNLDSDNVAPLGLTDASLASANNSTYKTIYTAASGVGDVLTGAPTIYFLITAVSGGGAVVGSIAATSPRSISTTSDVFPAPGLFDFDDADYAVAGKTTKMRVRASMVNNGTASTRNWVVGVYPTTYSGAADTFTITAGAVVPGTTATLTAPAASVRTAAVSTDATIPADGTYALGFTVSSGPASGFAGVLTAHVQIRNV